MQNSFGMCKGRQQIPTSMNEELSNTHGTLYEAMHGMNICWRVERTEQR
jgi:hypothetical protein